MSQTTKAVVGPFGSITRSVVTTVYAVAVGSMVIMLMTHDTNSPYRQSLAIIADHLWLLGGVVGTCYALAWWQFGFKRGSRFMLGAMLSAVIAVGMGAAFYSTGVPLAILLSEAAMITGAIVLGWTVLEEAVPGSRATPARSTLPAQAENSHTN